MCDLKNTILSFISTGVQRGKGAMSTYLSQFISTFESVRLLTNVIFAIFSFGCRFRLDFENKTRFFFIIAIRYTRNSNDEFIISFERLFLLVKFVSRGVFIKC